MPRLPFSWINCSPRRAREPAGPIRNHFALGGLVSRQTGSPFGYGRFALPPLERKVKDMRARLTGAGAIVLLAVGAVTVEAFPLRTPTEAGTMVRPAAMCGYTCRSGGRYIPGPPGVCAEQGLQYCGSSRGGYERRDYGDDDEEVVVRRRRVPEPYERGYAPRGSICVTSRGNCASRPAPRGAPCSCEIPGFGLKHGAIAQ
jgi:hypothetical protein